MICPECNANCWREEVNVGVGFYCSSWQCAECSWSEDDGFPMNQTDWDNWLNEPTN